MNFTYQYWTSSVTPSSGQAVQVQNSQPVAADINNGATPGAAEALARAR